MSIWHLNGEPAQNAIVERGLARCTFPFEKLLPSLQKEGRTQIEVAWQDLSRYNSREANRAGGDSGHSHIHDGEAEAHPIERTIFDPDTGEVRKRVLGLFYLPPYTKVVLDSALTNEPEVAQEVFLCEGAHAVDYHYLSATDRWEITNILHDEDLPVGADTRDGATFNLDGHVCSWFDVGTYEMWVGEAFMEAFVESFSDIKSTMSLFHAVSPEQARLIRDAVLNAEPLDPQESVQLAPEVLALAADLRRFVKTKAAPSYIKKAFSKAEAHLK